MATLLKAWKGDGFHKSVRLMKYALSDGSEHWEFRDRLGRPSNPTDEEAERIIKNYRMEEIDILNITTPLKGGEA